MIRTDCSIDNKFARILFTWIESIQVTKAAKIENLYEIILQRDENVILKRESFYEANNIINRTLVKYKDLYDWLISTST